MLEQAKTVQIEDPKTDVLSEGWLHKVMVAFQQAVHLPGIVVVALLLGLAGAAALSWRAVLVDSRLVTAVAVGQAVFLLSDMLLLINLPRKQRSFGPWQPQVFVLALPRVLATAVLALVATWTTTTAGLILAVLAQLIGSALLYYGTMVEPFQLELTELLAFSNHLATNAEPIRVLHISDLHVERVTEREAQVLALAKKANPDVIVITGDYVNLSYNRDPETARQVRHLLSQLSAPHGVYATLGSPPVDLRETVLPIFDGLTNVTLLRHGWAEVALGDGRFLNVLGIDCTHHLPTDRARLAQLVAKRPRHDIPQLLLFHSPELMPEAVQHGIDLYLCGHTHGGQVRLPLIGPLLTSSQLGRQYVMGIYKEKQTQLYVSRGIGLEGLSAPRIRFMAPPEMTLVTIRGKG